MSARPTFDSIKVGDTIPPLTLPPLDRTTLALFAGASGDHMPLHVDIDAARKAGLVDVFGHGMLSMAWLGRMLTNWVPQAAIRSIEVRFQGITHLGHIVTCTGKVVEKLAKDGETLVRLEIKSTDHYGQVKTVGESLVALPQTG
jgi:acyl dehydratase